MPDGKVIQTQIDEALHFKAYVPNDGMYRSHQLLLDGETEDICLVTDTEVTLMSWRRSDFVRLARRAIAMWGGERGES